MNLLNTLSYILNHPLNCNHKIAALKRFITWQIGSRILAAPLIMNFVNDSKLIVKTGMTHATGNLYCGLYEFEDMAFVLHYLRSSDLFLDIGANIGSFSILASSAVGARSVSIEPIPATYNQLVNNVSLNQITELVRALNIGVGNKNGQLKFSSTQGATNHVLVNGSDAAGAVTVDVRTLDSILQDESPDLLKIDVEGFETQVVEGAANILSEKTLRAVIMELNGSGSKYDFDEDLLHQKMLSYGFQTYKYDPFERKLLKTNYRNYSGNTLYIRDFQFVSDRVQQAQKFTVGDNSI
jgi:FkbM family methyltransferase